MPSREAQKDLQPSHGPFFFGLKPVNPPLFEDRSPNLYNAKRILFGEAI